MSKEPIRVLLWGLRVHGQPRDGRILLEKRELKSWPLSPRLARKRARTWAKYLGWKKRTRVTVCDMPLLPNGCGASNTASFVKEVFPQIKLILELGQTITIAEEMAIHGLPTRAVG